jgi:type I restriction enzyme S subunit
LAVPVPPTDEQALIVRAVAAADSEAVEQLVAIDHSLKQSTTQRLNILRAAFAGQLVPQDPNDEPASVLLERIRAERTAKLLVPKVRKVPKRDHMKSSNGESLHEWIKSQSGEAFSFDDIRAALEGDYEVLKESVFQLLASEKPIIEQFFDGRTGETRFRKVAQ